jgi:hypothetical protein
MTDFGSPDQADLLREVVESGKLDLHMCLPGIVQSYDDATKTCSVVPAVRKPIPTDLGDVVMTEHPIIQNVPVAVLGSPALSIECELAKGDTVLLVFFDYSIAAWRGSGQVSDPPDFRKHSPAYPIAVPWHRPNGRASSDEKSTIGKAGGMRVHFKASTVEVGSGGDFVALKSAVDAIQQNLDTAASFGTAWGPTTPGNLAAVGPQKSAANLKADPTT